MSTLTNCTMRKTGRWAGLGGQRSTSSGKTLERFRACTVAVLAVRARIVSRVSRSAHPKPSNRGTETRRPKNQPSTALWHLLKATTPMMTIAHNHTGTGSRREGSKESQAAVLRFCSPRIRHWRAGAPSMFAARQRQAVVFMVVEKDLSSI